jgi:hypothetical protein
MRIGVAPDSRAASTNGRGLKLSTWARITRAVGGQYRTDITAMIHHTRRLRIESATMPNGRIGTP